MAPGGSARGYRRPWGRAKASDFPTWAPGWGAEAPPAQTPEEAPQGRATQRFRALAFRRLREEAGEARALTLAGALLGAGGFLDMAALPPSLGGWPGLLAGAMAAAAAGLGALMIGTGGSRLARLRSERLLLEAAGEL